MEHLRIVFLVSLIITTTLSIGCDRPLPEPEKSDPIYSDLENELKTAKSSLDTEIKALSDAKKYLESLEPRDLNRKRATHEVFERQKRVRKLEERHLYQELLLKKRLEYVRNVYPKRYRAKEPWPDPQELDEYRTNRRLNRASRNWSDRVPKLQSRLKPPAQASPEKTSEEVKADTPAH